MKLVFLVCFATLLMAQTPYPFYTLAEPLQKDSKKLTSLNERLFNSDDSTMIQKFCEDVRKTLLLGEQATAKSNTNLMGEYLQQLRALSKRQEEIHRLYQRSLLDSIESKDKERFIYLASLELEPIHHPRIRSEAVAFYQKNFSKDSIQTLDSLCNEQLIEIKSIQYAIEQEKAYEEHLKTLKRKDVSKIKRGIKIGSRNSVIVVEEPGKNGEIVFEAENLNPFLVTLSLDFDRLDNLQANQKLPLYVELPGYTKKKIVSLSPIVQSAPIAHSATYGWVKGSAFAQHDDSYLYRLPFAKGSTVRVSQGYNGGYSHKGLSAYAIDFSMPIGTPIYAAREGEVVGVDVSSNTGGPSPEFRPFMNYVNIRHMDGTLGNYYHLKYGGAVVKIGEKIQKGQLIGYSGNTGYTTAPHLHFSVSKVDPVSMRRPMNLPIKIETAQGIVTNPHEGEFYTVQ